MDSKQNRTAFPSKLGLIARLLVAGYLVYIIISLGDVWNRYTGGELVLYIGAMVVFGVAAAVMSLLSIRDLVRGRYVGGKLDTETDSETELPDEITNKNL